MAGLDGLAWAPPLYVQLAPAGPPVVVKVTLIKELLKRLCLFKKRLSEMIQSFFSDPPDYSSL